MRFTEHAILRRIAKAAAAHAAATLKERGPQSATGAELRRWLAVLECWDAEHAGAAEAPRLPLLEDLRDG